MLIEFRILIRLDLGDAARTLSAVARAAEQLGWSLRVDIAMSGMSR